MKIIILILSVFLLTACGEDKQIIEAKNQFIEKVGKEKVVELRNIGIKKISTEKWILCGEVRTIDSQNKFTRFAMLSTGNPIFEKPSDSVFMFQSFNDIYYTCMKG